MKNALFILLFAFTSNAIAATITLDATNSGWYNTGPSSNGNINELLAGESGGKNYRNWIAFDLSSIIDTITGATLEIENNSPTSSLNIDFTWRKVSAITTPLLISQPTNLGTIGDIYDELVVGDIFASGKASGGSNDVYTLSGLGLASLNSATGLWAMGGTTAGDSDLAYGFTDGINAGDLIQLTLSFDPVVIPVPPAVWLFGSGLLTFFGFARQRKG